MRWRPLQSVTALLLLALPTFAGTVPSTNHGGNGLHPLSALPTQARSTYLNKRKTDSVPVHQLSSGWSLHIQHHFLLSPIAAAASTLSTFYEDIMVYAAQASDGYEEELTGFVMQVGELVLQFFTEEGLIPVSWDLVHDFAGAMKMLTERGFVGGLEAVLKCGVGEVVVRVGMVAWGTAARAA